MTRSTPAHEAASAVTRDVSTGVPRHSADVANTILQRHRGPRQRFDSADYALGDTFQRALALKALDAAAVGCVESSVKGWRRASASGDVEREPEPEQCRLGAEQRHALPCQSVRRLRLQRFDSADWAMQLDSDRRHRSSSGASDGEAKTAHSQRGDVAHLLLEHHTYRTFEYLRLETLSTVIMIDGVKKHAIVLVVAILFASYQIFQLEAGRHSRRASIDDEFDRAVRTIRESLPVGKYQVQLTQPLGATSQVFSRRALVINREFPVPRIEAEMFIDQQRASEQSKRQQQRGRGGSSAQSPSKRPANAPFRLRAYDPSAMEAVAKILLQRQLIAVVD